MVHNYVVERCMTKVGFSDSIYCVLACSKSRLVSQNKTILRNKPDVL